jgi:hypothetical protein
MIPMFVPLTTEMWPEVAANIKCIAMDDTRGVVAVDPETGKILAAGVADTYSHTACQVHLWLDNKMVLRHGFLEEVFDFVFNTCDRSVIIGMVPGDNERALRFNKHLGYEIICRIADGFNIGVDYVIMEMRKENCRFLNQQRAA